MREDYNLEMGRMLSGLYNLCRWITHFAYLNILWVAFTLLGGVIFGVFPSTVSLFTVARKTTMGEEGFSVFRVFIDTFRKEIFRANGLGWLLLIIGIIWYFDLNFFRQFNGFFFVTMNYLMVLIGLIYIILLLYVVPVYVYYDLKLLQYISRALKVAFLRPGNLSLIFLGTLGSYYFLIYVPAFIPLFGISLIAYFQMWVAYNCFESIHYYAHRKELVRK